MKKLFGIMMVSALFLSGCSGSTDDGPAPSEAPTPPEVEGPQGPPDSIGPEGDLPPDLL